MIDSMKISLKLFSSLMEYLPGDAIGNKVEVQMAAGASCKEVLAHLKIPDETIQVVMVNGEYVAPENRAEALSDGDAVSVWPSIQGG